MITKQDIDLYLSQIKTDDPNLQHLIACMSKDLKSIIDENEGLKKKIHTYKYAKARVEIEKLQEEKKKLEKEKDDIRYLYEDEHRYRKQYQRKLKKAKELLKDTANLKELQEKMDVLEGKIIDCRCEMKEIVEYCEVLFNEDE